MAPFENWRPEELLVVTAFAALGIATKQVLYPIATVVTAPLFIPQGAVAGGVYMLWLVAARGIVRRRWTATSVSLVQSFVVLLSPIGKHGLLTFAIYLAPGLAVDLVALATGSEMANPLRAVAAGIAANLSGTLLVAYLVFNLQSLPVSILVFLCTVAALSGSLGGYVAAGLVAAYRRAFPVRPEGVSARYLGTNG